ncbi:MAG: putative RNA polymerase sigma factor, partial [Limisphaerales bacterium]
SRLSLKGEIILLDKQDRTTWNQELINQGNFYMDKAAFGNKMSSYHLEAAISYEHCIAKTYEATNWLQILAYYDFLVEQADSPVVKLNRVIAILKVHGPEIALKSLDLIEQKEKLKEYHFYHALLADIYTLLGQIVKAEKHLKQGIKLTNSEAEQKLLQDKISALLN